jgi:catechol 2,3-dioxygenase-like lactoylglutathione lyase family enzyme
MMPASQQIRFLKETEMITNNLITSLLVNDYDEAIRFYREKLGFAVVEDVPMGNERWVTIALPKSHETVFALHVAKSDGDRGLVGKQGGTSSKPHHHSTICCP